MTNEELVVRMMNFSKYGALAQTVILSSLLKGLHHTTRQPRPDKVDDAVICPQLWYDIAVDLERQINEEFSK